MTGFQGHGDMSLLYKDLTLLVSTGKVKNPFLSQVRPCTGPFFFYVHGKFRFSPGFIFDSLNICIASCCYGRANLKGKT